MAPTPKQIYEVGLESLNSLPFKYIGYETGNDTDLGFPMWGGKDAAGNVNRFLCKNQKAKVTSMYVAPATADTAGEIRVDGKAGNALYIDNIDDTSGLQFKLGSATFLTVKKGTNEGWLGIGNAITDPSCPLEVRNTANALIRITDSDGTIGGGLQLVNGETNIVADHNIGFVDYMGKVGGVDTILARVGGTAPTSNTAHGQLDFWVNAGSGLEKVMAITKDKRIGVGTSSPACLLDLQATTNAYIKLTDTDGNIGGKIILKNGRTNVGEGHNCGIIDFVGMIDGAEKTVATITGNALTANEHSGHLSFWTANNGVHAQHMDLDENGRLSIFTTENNSLLLLQNDTEAETGDGLPVMRMNDLSFTHGMTNAMVYGDYFSIEPGFVDAGTGYPASGGAVIRAIRKTPVGSEEEIGKLSTLKIIGYAEAYDGTEDWSDGVIEFEARRINGTTSEAFNASNVAKTMFFCLKTGDTKLMRLEASSTPDSDLCAMLRVGNIAADYGLFGDTLEIYGAASLLGGVAVSGTANIYNLYLPNIPTYADNTAAASLAAGTVYKTATGELRIKV